MKKLIFILIVVVFVCTADKSATVSNVQTAPTVNANGDRATADYINETLNKLLDGLDFGEVENSFKDFKITTDFGGVKSAILGLINGDYNPTESAFKILSEAIFNDFGVLITAFGSILAIAILSVLVNGVSQSRMDKSLRDLTYFISLIVVLGIVLSLFAKVYGQSVDAVNSIAKQSEVMFPIMLTLLTASGGAKTATIFQPYSAFLINGILSIAKTVLLPIISILFALCVIGNLNQSVRLEKAKNFFGSAFKWVVGLSGVLFNFFVTAKGVTSSFYDQVSVKALKYALTSSLPFVGGIFSNGFDVVCSSMIIIKNAIGCFALIALVFSILLPICKIAVICLFLRLTSAITEVVGENRISNLLTKIADLMGYVTAVLVLSASTYFLSLLMLISSLGGAI